MKRIFALSLLGLLALACDTKDPTDEAADGDQTGDGDGDGDGDGEVACLDHQNAEACAAAGCDWGQAVHITAAEPSCTVEEYELCLPPPTDGGDPTCVSAIPGCTEPGAGPGYQQPAYIEHPEGGWVIIELCGGLEHADFTTCASGLDSAPAVCQCACSI